MVTRFFAFDVGPPPFLPLSPFVPVSFYVSPPPHPSPPPPPPLHSGHSPYAPSFGLRSSPSVLRPPPAAAARGAEQSRRRRVQSRAALHRVSAASPDKTRRLISAKPLLLQECLRSPPPLFASCAFSSSFFLSLPLFLSLTPSLFFCLHPPPHCSNQRHSSNLDTQQRLEPCRR